MLILLVSQQAKLLAFEGDFFSEPQKTDKFGTLKRSKMGFVVLYINGMDNKSTEVYDQLKPVAANFQNVTPFVLIDCGAGDAAKDHCKTNGISEFPTLKIYNTHEKTQDRQTTYYLDEGFTEQKISNWVLKHRNPEFFPTALFEPEMINQYYGRGEGILFFSKSYQLSFTQQRFSLYTKQVGQIYQQTHIDAIDEDKINFIKSEDLKQLVKPEEDQIIYCKKKEFHKYAGDFTMENLIDWIDGLTGKSDL